MVTHGNFWRQMSVTTLTVNCYQQCALEDTRGIFWMAFFKSEIRSDFLLQSALDTVQSCVVYMEMYGDTAFTLLHNAKIRAASQCCLPIQDQPLTP